MNILDVFVWRTAMEWHKGKKLPAYVILFAVIAFAVVVGWLIDKQ